MSSICKGDLVDGLVSTGLCQCQNPGFPSRMLHYSQMISVIHFNCGFNVEADQRWPMIRFFLDTTGQLVKRTKKPLFALSSNKSSRKS